MGLFKNKNQNRHSETNFLVIEKPNKIIYENQKEVWQKAKKYLLEIVTDEPCVQKATVWASLAEGQFGVYETTYKNRHEGSDIDLVVIVDEKHPIPKKWKFTNVNKSWFDLYHDLGVFKHGGHKHIVDGLLVFPSRHDLKEMETDLKGRSKLIYKKGDK